MNQDLEINGVKIRPIKDGESYRYLGQDENLSYDGPANKSRVTKEYCKRVRKIWASELSVYNKYVAHNAFAVPVLIPKFGILDWTIAEIKQLDIKTRKIMNMTGNFHINSDIDRLYLNRKNGGRGLKSIKTTFECRIISIERRLQLSRNRNKYLSKVIEHENDQLIRVAGELLVGTHINEETTDESTPRQMSQKYQSQCLQEKYNSYSTKVMHGYVNRKLENDNDIDLATSKSWTYDKYITSEFEAYACAIQEQEVGTKYLMNKRDKDSGKIPKCKNKCRLCKIHVEDVMHVISSCPLMSSTLSILFTLPP